MSPVTAQPAHGTHQRVRYVELGGVYAVDFMLEVCFFFFKPFLFVGVSGVTVQRKNVNIDPVVHVKVRRAPFDVCCAGISQLGKDVRIMPVCFICLQKEVRRQKSSCSLAKHAVIAARHGNVNVVVPWDKAAVFYGAETTSAYKIIA